MDCCNEAQQSFLLSFLCFVATTFLLWRTPIFKPLKLFAVFLHEFSHATAATLCCQRVTGIEVAWNEGGLCTYSVSQRRVYFIKCIVLPAGYLGSTLWGCGLVLATAWPTGAKVCGCVVVVALVIALFFAVCGVAKGLSERCLLIGLATFFGVVVGALTVLDFTLDTTETSYALETALLFIGAVNMTFATYDIYDDTVRRKDERSDAYKYAELVPCCFARCVGCTWFLLASAACVGSAFGHVYLVGDGSVAGSKDGGSACDLGDTDCLDWYEWLPGPIALAFGVGSHALCCALKRAHIIDREPGLSI